jgi:hypothetical protein
VRTPRTRFISELLCAGINTTVDGVKQEPIADTKVPQRTGQEQLSGMVGYDATKDMAEIPPSPYAEIPARADLNPTPWTAGLAVTDNASAHLGYKPGVDLFVGTRNDLSIRDLSKYIDPLLPQPAFKKTAGSTTALSRTKRSAKAKAKLKPSPLLKSLMKKAV